MIEIGRRIPLIAQKQWMEEQLDVFRDAILKSNNEWCFTKRLKVQERVEAELPEALRGCVKSRLG